MDETLEHYMKREVIRRDDSRGKQQMDNDYMGQRTLNNAFIEELL